MTLSLKNVSLRVDAQTHIYETTIDLQADGFNILLGTTLAGKTTLMHLMAGLIKPTNGQILFGGQDVTGHPVQKRNVSMVFQQFINYPNMSVYENIASPLKVAGLSAQRIKERVGSVAEMLRMTPFLDRRPSELSGGQQQRCAMARALVKDADLVLLDEPLANLDYKLREELRDELPRLFADRQCTVVYATTEPTEALLLGGHTMAMYEGSVLQFDETSLVYRQPGNLKIAQVFSEPPMNTVPIQKRGDMFEMTGAQRVQWPALGALLSLADGEYTLGMRPHHVTPATGSGDQPTVSGAVMVTEISGSESTVHFTMNERPWVSQAHGVHALRAGDNVAMQFEVSRALYFSPDGVLVHA